MLDNYITIGVEFSYLANVREVTTCRIFRGWTFYCCSFFLSTNVDNVIFAADIEEDLFL